MHADSYLRGEALLSSMSDKCSVIVRKLSADTAEERAYGRFLDNPRVPFSEVLSSYRPPPPPLSGRHILIVEDTTEVSFGLEPNKKELGKTGNGHHSGFFFHPAICLDAKNGGCLGLGSADVYVRQAYEPTEQELQSAKASLEKSALKAVNKLLKAGKTEADLSPVKPPTAKAIASLARERHQSHLPFEEKNRYRWLKTATDAAQYYQEAARKTVIADCEGDIYQLFVGFVVQKLDFVIRTYHNRYLEHLKSASTLRTQSHEWAVQCCYKLKLPATDKRSAHEAILNVSYQKVAIACPEQAAKEILTLPSQPIQTLVAMPEQLTLYAVRVSEDPSSVVNNEKPIDWLLLTSHEVESCEQALEIIQFYCWRWVIEQVFRTLKSQGLNIQSSRLDNYEALTKLALLALMAAVQILQLVQARDGKTEQKSDEIFEPIEIQVIEQLNKQLEGKTAKQKNPHPPLSLAFAAWVIARLGGWKPNASPRPPGPITLFDGMVIFHNIVCGYKLNSIPMDP